MKRISPKRTPLLPIALTLFLSGWVAFGVHAQSVGVTAKPLLRAALSDDTTKESVMLAVEFAPGGTTGRHLHHGDEYATVLQGSLELVADGKETRTVSAGEAFHNPRGLIHEARNKGDTPVRLNILFVVDKGKPIVEPVAN